MASKVIDVEALHDQDDRTLALVVEPRGHGLFVPIDCAPTCGRGSSFIRLQGVIYDDELPPAAGQRSANRCGEPKPALRGPHLGFGILRRVDTSLGEQAFVWLGFNEPSKIV